MVTTSTTKSVRERRLCSGINSLGGGVDFVSCNTDATKANNYHWKIIDYYVYNFINCIISR